MPQLRAWSLALLLACLVAFVPIGPVAAWDHDTHRRTVQDALQVMPSDLRTLLEGNQGALLGGCVAPDVEFRDFYNHVWHVDEPYGGGVQTCLKAIDTIIALIQQGAPASEIAREFGILSHYVADIGCPLHTSSKDPNEDYYHSTFESDVGDHLFEITFEFDGLQFVSDREARLKGCAQFAYQYYDAIAAAYAATTATTTIQTTSTASTQTSTTTTQQTAAGKYCGSSKSDVYHYPSCSYVKQIKPENLIWFVDEKDAKNRGYRPCKVCKPPDCGYEDLTGIIPPVYNHAVNAIADLWYTAWTLAQPTTQTTGTTTSAATTPPTSTISITISTSTSSTLQTEATTTSMSTLLTATSTTPITSTTTVSTTMTSQPSTATSTTASEQTTLLPSTTGSQVITTTETRAFATTRIETTTVTRAGLPTIPPDVLSIVAIAGLAALIVAILVRRTIAHREIDRSGDERQTVLESTASFVTVPVSSVVVFVDFSHDEM